VGAARFVAGKGAEGDDAGQEEHVFELAGEIERLIGPLGAVTEIDFAITGLQPLNLAVGHLKILVDASDSDVLGHNVAELPPDGHGILGAFLGEKGLVFVVLALLFAVKDRGWNRFSSFLEIFRVLHGGRAGDAATKNATHKRIGTETIGAVILVFALAGGVDAGDVGGLINVVHPDAAHSVMHAGEDLHRLDAGIDTAEFFIDFENAFELAIESFAVDVRNVEIDGSLAIEAELFLINDAMNGAGGDVARNEVPVFRIPLLEKVEALVFGNGSGGARVAGLFGNPDAAPFATGGLAHQAELVFARDRSGVDLDEFAVGVIDALLEERGLRGAGADDGVGGAAKDGADSAGAEDDRIGGKGFDFHGAEIHGGDAAANANVVDDRGEKRVAFELFDLAFGFVAADLFVEGVEKLLAGGGAGKGGAVIKGTAETAIVQEAFGRAIKHDAHAIEEIDDARGVVAHTLDEGLIGEEIAAVDGVVEMLGRGVAFALLVFRGVDAALRANRMRALYGNDGEEVDGDARFGDANGRHESGQTTTHNDDFWLSHFNQ